MRKRVLSVLLAAVMILTMIPATAFAGTVQWSGTFDGVKWEIDNAGVLTISKGNATEKCKAGEMGNLGSWSSEAWKLHDNDVTSVVIKDGVKNIGKNAFYGMYNVGSVKFADSVEFIGECAFYNTSIESLVIPGSVTEIAKQAFWSAYELKTLTLEDGVESIGIQAFMDCSQLHDITLPDSLTNVGMEAFNNTAYLRADKESGKEFSIIGNVLIKGHKSYEYDEPTVIPEGVKIIAGSAFLNNDIYDLVLPESLEYIGGMAFADESYSFKNKHYMNVDLKNVKHIGEKAFANCRYLQAIDLSNVEYLADNAFYWCDSMKTATISDKIKYMGPDIFGTCDDLHTINLPDTFSNLEYMSASALPLSKVTGVEINNGIYYFKNVFLRMLADPGYDYGTELAIKDGTTVIADEAFGYSDSGFTSLVIPESMKAIGDVSVLYSLTDIYYAGDKAGWDAIIKEVPGKDTYYITAFYDNINIHCAKSSAVEMNTCGVTLEYTKKTYTGKALTPAVTVTDSKGKTIVKDKDYKLTYTNNINAGTATVTLTGMGNYTGTVEKTFTISKVGAASITAKLSDNKFTYTGKAQTPNIAATDNNGNTLKAERDYTCKYNKATRKGTGVYKITVTFKGNYSGTKNFEYVIVPGATSTLKTELSTAKNGYKDVVLKWDVTPLASGYYVYFKKSSDAKWTKAADLKRKDIGNTYTKKKLLAGTKYDFKVVAYYKAPNTGKKYEAEKFKTKSITTLAQVKKINVSKVNAKKIKISWQKLNGVAGYEVVRMTAKKQKYTVKQTWNVGSAKTSLTISPVKGTKFYYKVRAYHKVTVNKKTVKVYGPWSVVKPYNLKK